MKHNSLKSLCYYIAQCEQSNKVYKKEKRNIITANDFSPEDITEISITAKRLNNEILGKCQRITTYKDFERLIKNLESITKHFIYNIKIQNEIWQKAEINI